MRYFALVLMSALAVACDPPPRDAGPPLQPEAPNTPSSTPVPTPPPAPVPPADVVVAPPAIPPSPAAPAPPTDVPGTPPATPDGADPRADLTARVVIDAAGARYELTASAPKPWVVKSETPFNLTLHPSSGVRLRKQIFDRRDFVDPLAPVKQINAEIDASPGEHVIDASAELYVCSAELCKRMNEKVHTTFTIPKS